METYSADNALTTGFSAVFALIKSTMDFITGDAWMVILIALPIVGAFLGLAFALFHSRKG